MKQLDVILYSWMSSAQFADKLQGVPAERVQRWRKGEVPPPHMIRRIGRALHQSIDSFMEANGVRPRKCSPIRKGTRFPFIQQHADELGVSRPHLWQVLTGKRSSPELLSSYTRLLISEGRPIPADLGKAA